MTALRESTAGYIPRLENGDRLTVAEFERRYEAMPDEKKAELIEGVVYLSSPVSVSHAQADSAVHTWLGAYSARHPRLQLLVNATVRIDRDSEFQPDALLRTHDGGTSRTTPDGYLEGPPELVVEVAASSVSRDLHSKKNVYRRAGVREYIVLRLLDAELDWFELRAGEYVRRSAGAGGMIESVQFPGLRLDVPALLAGDLPRLLAALG
ncbi:MAG: Uma2 family endonuclease [Dehalococcoidia bacterium]|nr:Uma2 family endonuclease [Dehalococcoidia bacterium]